MSDPTKDLIRDLSAAGIRLSRRGDRLHVEAPKGTITHELKIKLAEVKPALLALLSADEMRQTLRALADSEGIARALIDKLGNADACDSSSLTTETLTAYVRAIRDIDLRKRGKVPADETAVAICRSCGPIWTHPSVAGVAPIVDRWPRLLGCPWCHVRNREGMPRPTA